MRSSFNRLRSCTVRRAAGGDQVCPEKALRLCGRAGWVACTAAGDRASGCYTWAAHCLGGAGQALGRAASTHNPL